METRIVNFVLAGAQKCGTTSLSEQLSAHPDVGFCVEKEPHFFSKHPAPLNSAALAEYHGRFEPQNAVLWGEASTSYMFFDEYPHVAPTLSQYNPDMRIIIMLRDPVKRIISHLHHRIRKGYIRGDNIHTELATCTDYIDRSSYGRQIAAYQAVFSPEQIRIYNFEQYIRDPAPVVEDALRFIGADMQKWDPESLSREAKNISDAKVRLGHIPGATAVLSYLEKQPWSWRLSRLIPLNTPMPEGIEQALWLRLKEDVDLLESSTGFDASAWKNKYHHFG
ncbi:MAG: sulfotransferase domain-containing protein [Planctomycetes bacterium]|nr:sulfotransferase domain-containing protein [Planctomycetota bacterium]